MDDRGASGGRGTDGGSTPRERAAVVVEERLDVPMAVLAVVWAGLVAYELVAPDSARDELAVVGNVIWVVFVAEFGLKLWVSGHPLRFLWRRWPSLLFLLLPALRLLRVVGAARVLRALPAARIVGSTYRAIGTARSLLGGRLAFLGVASAAVVFSGGQLFYLIERRSAATSLGDSLWWSANVALTGNLVAEPVTLAGRLISLALSVYSVVVIASVAGTIGAFLVETRAERAAAEESGSDTSGGSDEPGDADGGGAGHGP